MRVLVACEESQKVCLAFRAIGHEAFSCDIIECSGGHPEWHIQDDALRHLNDGWDMMIAFPPCTYLCNSGVRWLYQKDGLTINEDRWYRMKKGAEFFKILLNAPIPKKVIENSLPHKYAVKIIGRKYDQIIQPNQFGHPESKTTCLWIEGLDLLTSTKILTKPACGYWENQTPSGQNKLGPSKDRARLRGTTYQGVADAMALQWGLEL